MIDDTNKTDPKIDELFQKLTESRDKLEKDAVDTEALKTMVKSLFPATIDYRSKYLLDEKLKVVSTFMGMSLNIRQEIDRLILQEIELRRKIKFEDKNKKGDFRDFIDNFENQYTITKRSTTEEQLDFQSNNPEQKNTETKIIS